MRLLQCPLLAICLAIAACTQPPREEVLLREALSELERIKTAEYRVNSTAYSPEDTLYKQWYTREVKSYENPSDTTIGVSWVKMSIKGDSKEFLSAYDGEIHATSYHEHKGILLDDFTTRNLPFRPMTSPFFFYARSIVDYTLTTTDSIEWSVSESEDIYHLSLTIHEPNQVEFFGRAYQMPELPEAMRATHDPTSHYQIWFDKSTNLPKRIYREMSTNVSEQEIIGDAKFNTLSLDDLRIEDYYPEGYEIRMKGAKKSAKAATTTDLIGKKAPNFTLEKWNGETVELNKVESRVTLLNFTGIGCGPCMLAIPMLSEMEKKYSSKELQIISIESWGKGANSLQNYAQLHNIEYSFLVGKQSVLGDYHISGVPVFVLLDDSHTIRKVYNGYDPESSATQIKNNVRRLQGGEL